MILKEFEEGLKRVFPNVYQTAAPKGLKRYVVWAQYGRSSLLGDDKNQVDAPKIQLDIITNIPNDIIPDDILAALWAMDLPYSVESEGYDDEYAAFRTIVQTVVI